MPCDEDAASRTYGQLEETVAALPASESLTLSERASRAWSMVHGFATLCLENERFATSQGSTPEESVETLRRMLHASRRVFTGE